MNDMHDFGDGRGPVPAKRHVNPDGSMGGWVADAAHVDRGVHVDPAALVYGEARVCGEAQVCGEEEVSSGVHE